MEGEPGGLSGVNWRVIGMIDDGDVFSPVLGNVAITATFDEQNWVSGGSGCNRYTGPATWGEGSISIGAVAGTRMMCSDSLVMAQESRYLRLLTAAGSYRVSAGIEGSGVDFFDHEGTRILEYVEIA
jgi:hypothetical protein